MVDPVTPSTLRTLIAGALYPTSAYSLPLVCEELGMAPGSGEEAFRSKTKYVVARLSSLSSDDLITMARRVADAHPDYNLIEAIKKMDEQKLRSISSLTRKHLFKAMNDFSLSGDEDLVALLKRFWPIDTMVWNSTDGQFSHPFADIVRRHAVENDDVSNEEILEQLGARKCSQSLLFEFLEAIVHPELRQESVQLRMVEAINAILERDGFTLGPGPLISGYRTFVVREKSSGSPADIEISEALLAFDEEGVHAAWRKALDRRRADPEGAITAARTLLETVCNHIIEASGGTLDRTIDLPVLYRAAAKVLNLAPDQHTEEVFKAILGSCQNVVNSLGTLRNRLSDAHGHGRKPVRPSARHAELAVNLAGTMATFLVATWNERSK